jgi:hypothetical protein
MSAHISGQLIEQNPSGFCQHGGEIVNGLAYCGICLKLGNEVSDFERFLVKIHKICLIAANAVWSPAVLRADRQSHAFVAVLTNLQTVVAARCPSAMAYTIAHRSLINLTMRAMNKNELPVSIVIPSDLFEGEEISMSDKLEFLDGAKKDDYARRRKPSRVVYFPGKQSVWKPFYLHQLEASVDRAFKLLPVQPVRQSLAVKLWLGIVPQRKAKSYKEIASLFNISERQVRYQVQKGLSTLRTALEEEAKLPGVLWAP